MTRDLKVQICAAAVHEAARALDPKLPAWAKVPEPAKAATMYAVEAVLAGDKPAGTQPEHLRHTVATMAKLIDLPHAPIPRDEPKSEPKVEAKVEPKVEPKSKGPTRHA